MSEGEFEKDFGTEITTKQLFEDRSDENEQSTCNKECCSDGYRIAYGYEPKSDCENSDDDEKHEDSDSGPSNRRSRKQSSITDVLNLGDDPVTEKEETEQMEKSTAGSSTSGKSRHRSGGKKRKHVKKRKWKPYHKLTWQERQKVQERDTRRAQRVRSELTAVGIALAPDNTNQFLMKDHLCETTPDYDKMINEDMETEEDLKKFYDKEFEEAYETYHFQFMNKLTKFELVERWIDKEDQIEKIEKQLHAVRESKRSLGLDVDSEMAKIEVFKDEINKLREENDVLYGKNEKLRKYLSVTF